jgi:hypothetical protein
MTVTDPPAVPRPVEATAPRRIVIEGLHVGWLNALIVGATILVWLSLIGSVYLAVEIAREASSDEPVLDSPFDGENTNCPEGTYFDDGFCVRP